MGWGSYAPDDDHVTLEHVIVISVQCECLQVMMDFLKEWEEKLHVKITCSQVQLAALSLMHRRSAAY